MANQTQADAPATTQSAAPPGVRANLVPRDTGLYVLAGVGLALLAVLGLSSGGPQHIVNGLLTGGVLALVGLGFSLVWGILNIINLAHAMIIMLAAFLSYFLFERVGVDPFVSLVPVMLVMAVVGYLLQRYLINLVIRAPLLVTFLLTYGIEIFLLTVAQRLFSADFRRIKPAYVDASLQIGNVTIVYSQLAGLAIGIALTVALYLFMARTKIGNAIRAVGIDLPAARLMGINIARTYAITYALGAALAAAAGVMLAVTSPFAPQSFGIYNIRAFSVVVLGGLGSVPGAFIGGIAFGLLGEFAATYAPAQTDVIIFVALIILLILRPTGLLGREGYR